MITRIRKMSSDYQTLITSRYPNEFKKKVILYAEKYNNSEAERIFGIAESNIRRWRKLKPLIFSKNFVSENARKKRLAKKVAQSNDDFIYEIEKLEDMLDCAKQPVTKDYTRVPKRELSPKIKYSQSPPVLSPNVSSTPQDKTISNDPEAEEVCLRWNSHHSNMKTSFPTLLQKEQYVDVTLTSEGKSVKCHRLILSSCSAYFDELLSGISPLQHPVIFLNGVPFWVLKCLIDFMYAGEVHIEQNKLETLLKVAEMLQIKGLTGKMPTDEPKPTPPAPAPITVKNEKQIQEPKSPLLKKETSTAPSSSTIPAKSPIRRSLPASLPIDPLSLLEPTFFEENPIPLKFKEHVSKKVVSKKIKKRKLSEHDPSPPPILYRKGTKSRPHVKVPRYYHNDYEDLDGKKTSKKEPPLTQNTSDFIEIKAEPIEIEMSDTLMDDGRKTKDTSDKVKYKEPPSETTMDESDELKTNKENSDSTDDSVDIVAKEIKQENIDVDYNDLEDISDKNLTI